MVRIEYRAGRGKILREMQKHGCTELQDFLDRTSEIAAENIPGLIRMCYGSGKFVKYGEAAACIEASGMKRKTKEKMMGILLNVAKHSLAYEKENGKIIAMDVYGDNRNIIPDEIPELLAYMDDVMPKKCPAPKKRVTDIVADPGGYLPAKGRSGENRDTE